MFGDVRRRWEKSVFFVFFNIIIIMRGEPCGVLEFSVRLFFSGFFFYMIPEAG